MPDSGLAGGRSDGAPGGLPSIPDDSRPDADREAALRKGVRMPAPLERGDKAGDKAHAVSQVGAG
jgi:hypothetical protein